MSYLKPDNICCCLNLALVTISRALADKAWEAGVGVGLPVRGARREIRAGITGIEKKMNQQAKQDSANISKV